MNDDEFEGQDESSMAAFVDALSAALMIMVLISLFFMLNSATAVIDLAKRVPVTFISVDEEAPPFNPVVFRPPIRLDLDAQQIVYLLNFRLDSEQIAAINDSIRDYRSLHVRIVSSETPEKVTAMLIRFLSIIENPLEKDITTTFEIVTDNVSILSWEGI
jgi:hypothetical protein